jgi:hypothetical protein
MPRTNREVPACHATPDATRLLEAELKRIRRFIRVEAVRFGEGFLSRSAMLHEQR